MSDDFINKNQYDSVFVGRLKPYVEAVPKLESELQAVSEAV